MSLKPEKSLSEHLSEFESIIQNKTGVYVLEDGDSAMLSRAWLCNAAEQSIDIQYFIFSMDNVGIIACDYLVKAADRGVKVRILIDDIMVNVGADELLAFQGHPNIEIKIYNSNIRLGKTFWQRIFRVFTQFRAINQRMHNKTFIVDKKISITGGRNIADEYFDYDHSYNFRDRDVLLLGKSSFEIHDSFELFWNNDLSQGVYQVLKTKTGKIEPEVLFADLNKYASNPENYWPQVRAKLNEIPHAFSLIQESGAFRWVNQVEFVSDLPGKNSGEEGLGGSGLSTEKLVSLFLSAKKSIVIQSPYLIVTKRGLNLFEDAVKSGIEVRILTNSLCSTDNLEAFSGYKRDRKKMLKTGIRIFEFKPDAKVRYELMTSVLQQTLNFTPVFGLHAKSMVIDDEISVIGTFNLDPRSANLNTECASIVYSKEITTGVLEGMEIEFRPENAWEITLNFNPDHFASFGKRVKTFLRRLVPKRIL